MSSTTSPTHYNEDAFISDANFKVDISQKMKVPNKISFNNDLTNGDKNNGWNHESLNMHVPERILVVGQHQHVGTRAPPREIDFDNSLLQTDPYPSDPRVATPPRQLTLDKYPFPLVDEYDEKEELERIPVARKHNVKYDMNNSTDLSISRREATPPIGSGGDGLTPAEEVHHLRRQMAKMNRRVMALELENLNRLQKEKIMYGLGIAYFLLKAIFWLNRN